MDIRKAFGLFKDSLSTKRGKILAVVAALLLIGAVSSCASGNKADSELKLSQTGNTQAQVETTTPKAFSYTVEAQDWNGSPDDYVVVLVEGKDDNGTAVSKKFKATPGAEYDLDLNPGTYDFSIAPESPVIAETIFAALPTKIVFDGTKDQRTVLKIAPDAEATAQYVAQKEAERVAAEQREAEARAQAEAKAAAEAKAQQEAQAAAQTQKAAAAKQSAPSSGGGTVYIATSGKGGRYHSKPQCGNMKKSTPLSRSEAESRGYTPCKNCY